VSDEREMADAVGRLDRIDPARCRHSVASRYDVAVVAEDHEAVYVQAIRAARRAVRADRSPQWAAGARHRTKPARRRTGRAQAVSLTGGRPTALQPVGR
jgi:hypothetical protein